MKILRVNMANSEVAFEELPKDWELIGGRGLVAKIMNQEVRPDIDPLGPESKLIIAGGPLAGTLAPQLGRISVGGKSPLTLGIKEANAGGPAAQKLDRLGIRAIIVEGSPPEGKLFCLEIAQDKVKLVPADEYRGMKNYELARAIYKKYDKKPAIISIGIAGERQYKSASVSLTDMFGDPSRNAGRGGLGAVMGAKGLKVIVIDDTGTPPIKLANESLFRETVRSWISTLDKDVTCGLYSKFGTPFVVASNAYRGTMPANNYTSGRPEGFSKVTGEVIKKNVWERGGRMHGCMPGCVVQCSIVYNDAQKKHLASAYEYEAVGLLGTNLGIYDPDAIGRMVYICDDLGLDLIEVGSSLGVAASAGKMKMGDAESARALLGEIEKGTSFGRTLADGVVATAKALHISRVPAFKGQAIPAHEPRTAKGIGVTYATSPMGGDHTAGLTYRAHTQKTGQLENSLRAQLDASVCDTFGYCLNAVPGGQASLISFLTDLLNARYGTSLTGDDVFGMARQTIKDEYTFNDGAEFSKIYERYPAYIRTEPLPPTNHVFDVEDAEIDSARAKLETFNQVKKIWEVQFPTFPPILFGAGVIQRLGERAKALNIKKAFIATDPIMQKMGRASEAQAILKRSGVDSFIYADVEPDPPVEAIEKAGKVYKEQGCDGLIGLGGGSSMDTAKATGLRVSQSGLMTEFESMMGGAAKIKPPLPPVICVPTTSGTGSEANQYAVITDKQREVKFIILSNLIIPKLAVVDPNLCKTMPPSLTAETGVDALGHCIEGYVGLSIPYHPFYEALALYGVKLIGRSLRAAYRNGDDIAARTDMCMAAIYGGVSFTKGLGIGHAIGHALGAHYHVSHGKAVSFGLLCFVRAINEHFKKEYLPERSPLADLAWALDRTDNLELALVNLYKDIGIPSRLRDFGIPEADLEKIAFETSKDVANLASNPVPINMRQILELLKTFY